MRTGTVLRYLFLRMEFANTTLEQSVLSAN